MASSSISIQIDGDASGFTKALDKSAGALGTFGKNIGKIGAGAALAGGAVIGGAVIKGVSSAFDRGGIRNALANNLGLDDEQAKAAGSAAGASYGQGFGQSYEENAQIASTLAGLGVESVEALTDQTRQATAITETFAIDQAELLAGASALIDRGFVESTGEAFDLLAVAAEGSFISLSEQLDLVNEYGDQIAQVGITGEEAFAAISSASSSFEADKILDTFKELAIRGQDMSDTSVSALETLGLSAEETAEAFALGGTAAADARDDILRALGDLEDPTERNRLGVELMGTAYEDLGLDPLSKLGRINSELGLTADSAEDLAEKSLTVGDRFGALGRKGENALEKLGEAVLPFLEKAMPHLEAAMGRGIELFEQHMPDAVRFLQDVFVQLEPVFKAVLDVAVSVFDWFQENWPPIQAVVLDVFQSISDWVVENWPLISEIIVEAMTLIGEIIAEVVELVSAIWERWGDEILLVLETVFKVMGPIVRDALELVRDVISTITSLIKGDWSAFWDGIKSIFTGAFDLLQSILDARMELLKIGGELAMKAIKQVFGDAWDGITGAVERALDSIVNAIKNLGGRVKKAASGAFDGLLNAIPGAGAIGGLLSFHDGGTVPGPPGRERLAVLEAGERVWSRAEVAAGQGGGSGVTIGQVTVLDGRDFFDTLDRKAMLV